MQLPLPEQQQQQRHLPQLLQAQTPVGGRALGNQLVLNPQQEAAFSLLIAGLPEQCMQAQELQHPGQQPRLRGAAFGECVLWLW